MTSHPPGRTRVHLPTRILIVEDHPDTALVLATELAHAGHEVETVGSGNDALDRLSEQSYELIILDLGLPDMSGEEVLAGLRSRGDSTLVLILSARGQAAADRIEGFNLGADDYMSKPFEMGELQARVQALLRRAARAQAAKPDAPDTVWKFGDFEVAPRWRTVRRQGRQVKLRPMEYDLLMVLIENRGRAISRKELLEKVWRYPASVHTRTLVTHIHRLRTALEDDPHHPRHILTVHGLGYRFEP